MSLAGFCFAAPNRFMTQIHRRITEQDLTSGKPVLEYRKFREILPPLFGDLPDYDLKADPFSSERFHEAAV
jgi:hypothetical protein